MNFSRCKLLIDQAIAKLDLHLDDMVVLTEAATGNFVLTPMIAAQAGAKQVLAVTRDSRFGTAQAVKRGTMDLARRWGLENKIEVIFSREDPRIAQADIVTNLNYVRPLDAAMLGRLKPTAVIPLMFETWEYRPSDLDLEEARRLGLCVLGTNERDKRLRILEYIGPVAIKLAMESGVEVFNSKVVVVGGGHFGQATVQAMQSAGAEVFQVQPRQGQSLGDEATLEKLAAADLLVMVEHEDHSMLLGAGGQLEIDKLREIAPQICIAHIAGGVDVKALDRSGISCRPRMPAKPGRMSVTTEYVGPKPMIDLHAAGLKVGEAMAKGMRKSGDAKKAAKYALKNSPAMEFEKPN
jgi:hypothetical protein